MWKCVDYPDDCTTHIVANKSSSDAGCWFADLDDGGLKRRAEN